ncbi:hypothetical protein ACFLQL_03400 [Verrucomicrobiota bacterium]
MDLPPCYCSAGKEHRTNPWTHTPTHRPRRPLIACQARPFFDLNPRPKYQLSMLATRLAWVDPDSGIPPCGNLLRRSKASGCDLSSPTEAGYAKAGDREPQGCLLRRNKTLGYEGWILAKKGEKLKK